MIPRTVQMSRVVAAQFTSTELIDYGNIILNGYEYTVPNTVNKKAWQYWETATAPINLPSLPQIIPALKGWTTNYQEYYTQLQPNGYGVNPGDPTMFEYTVHSYLPAQPSVSGIISVTGVLVPGTGYIPGTYRISLIGGTGNGAYGSVEVGAGGGVTAFSITNPGGDYPAGLGSASNSVTRTITGSGTNLRVDYSWFNGSLFSVSAITSPGTGYAIGDTVFVGTVESGIITITAVTAAGGVTGFTLIAPGSGYTLGNILTGDVPGGAGWSIAVIGVTSTPAVAGGASRWSQPPRRLIQNRVSPSVPSVNNREVIPYSAILYPSSM